MEQLFELNDLQVDALQEVANIGSGHAATVLSQMTDRRVMIDVPRVATCHPEEVAGLFDKDNGRVVALLTRMLGDFTGHTFFVMREPGARLLADLLLGRKPGVGGRNIDEVERSSLIEAGNILAGSFMNALAAVVGGVLLPSVPQLVIERSSAVADRLNLSAHAEYVFFVETEFYVNRPDATPECLEELRGGFFFVPDSACLNLLLHALTVG